jgi:hypothetical protein
MISEVGCKWFHVNEENPSERVINIELNDAVQTLTFYWSDNEERQLIPLENIIPNALPANSTGSSGTPYPYAPTCLRPL